MFAIIKSGGKQYKVAAGDVLRVEKLNGSAGDKINVPDVLMVGKDAKDFSLNAGKVAAEIVRQFRADKVLIFKKKRRHNYRRKKGHRQFLTEIRITDITA